MTWRLLVFIFPILFVVMLWEFISQSSFVNPALFPPPSKVAVALWEMVVAGTLFTDLYDSLWRLFIGLFVGASIGVIVGLLTGRVKSFARAVSPVIQVLRPLPPVAIIPLVIVWFGIDDGAKIFSIAFAVFFPVWINTYIGAERVPPAYLWAARLLTLSPVRIFREVIFHASLPFIVAGARSGIAIAFIMIFVSELAGASSGIGYRISITHLAYRIDEMMAGLVVLGACGALADYLFVRGVHRFFPWMRFSHS